MRRGLPPLTCRRADSDAVVRVKIAPQLGEWATLQNGRHEQRLRRRLARHATTSRVQIHLDTDRRRSETKRRRPAGRSKSADDADGGSTSAALPPLSLADTMRFGHDLSLALGERRAGSRHAQIVEEEQDDDDDDSLELSLSRDVVAAALDGAVEDAGASRGEGGGEPQGEKGAGEKKRVLHVSSPTLAEARFVAGSESPGKRREEGSTGMFPPLRYERNRRFVWLLANSFP